MSMTQSKGPKHQNTYLRMFIFAKHVWHLIYRRYVLTCSMFVLYGKIALIYVHPEFIQKIGNGQNIKGVMTSEIYAWICRQTFSFSAVFNINLFSNESMISVMTSLVIAARTRTKDKYRIVYSDHQRLELEKEFHYSRYITIRRKAELANMIGLSERQVASSKNISRIFINF